MEGLKFSEDFYEFLTVALLFQDMFPVTEKYIDGLYIRNGEIFCISDPKKNYTAWKTDQKSGSFIAKNPIYDNTAGYTKDLSYDERRVAARQSKVVIKNG